MQKGPDAVRKDRKDHRRRGSVMGLFSESVDNPPPPPLPASPPTAAPPLPTPDSTPAPAKGSRLKRIKSQIFGGKKEEAPAPEAARPHDKKDKSLRRSLQLFFSKEKESEENKEECIADLSKELDKMLQEPPSSPKPKMEGKVGAVQLYYSNPNAKPFDHIAHEKQVREMQAQREPIQKEKAKKEKAAIAALIVKKPAKSITPGFQLVKRSDSVCELVPIPSDEGPSSSKPNRPL